MALSVNFRRTIMVFAAPVFLGCTPSAKSEPPEEPQFQKILPGDDSIDTDLLSDHKIEYSKPGGSMTVRVERELLGARPLITTNVWFNTDDTAPNPDTIQHDAATMSFYSRKFGNPEVYVIDFKFVQGRFTGALTPGPESNFTAVDYDKAYSHGGFEPAIIFNAIRTLPLAIGYKASIPVFDLNDGAQMYWSNIEVVGREEVHVGGKSYDTLKVVSKGIRTKTLWFVDSLPYPVQMKTNGSPGLWKVQS